MDRFVIHSKFKFTLIIDGTVYLARLCWLVGIYYSACMCFEHYNEDASKSNKQLECVVYIIKVTLSEAFGAKVMHRH